MHETRRRGDPGSLVGATAAQPREEALDDWLGDISDDDWSEDPTEIAAGRHATPAYQERPLPEKVSREPTAEFPGRPIAAAEAHRAIVERRRLVAGLVVVIVLALAVVIPVLLLRGQDQAPAAPVTEATGAAPTRTETSPSTPTRPATTPPTTPSFTTPSAASASTFTLPEGTKLQRDKDDPAVITDLEPITDRDVVTELQQALSSAGYDPGAPDGTFGRRTEAAVIAFQQANGLSPDGVVGPETASALNGVITGG